MARPGTWWVAVVLVAAACGNDPDDAGVAGGDEGPGGELVGRIQLTETAGELGLGFVHRSGAGGSYPMPAVMGGGFAVFDLEGDGDLDIFAVSGGDRFPPTRGSGDSGNALYRQEADGRFADVTLQAGLEDERYGMGVAVGDIDNDGDPDLFVSNWGRDSLYRNEGDGTFVDITDRARVGGEGWSASAVFCDLDGDALLDLFVTRYLAYDPARECTVEGGRVDFCGPTSSEGLSDRVYRNRGDGRFEDISRSSGVAALEDAGLGVVCEDFDADGRLDVYVANDADPNHLWINQGEGRFVEDAVLVGLAFNRYGVAEGGMGALAGDVDDDGDVDVFVSHLIEESSTYYENRGAAGFEDATGVSGLGLPSVPFTGFGDAFADLDNDSDLDLVVANGAVKRRPAAASGAQSGFWGFYGEPDLLLENLGAGRFLDVGAGFAAWSGAVDVSRGLVAADLDRDGDLDLVISRLDGSLRVWRNDGGDAAGSLEVHLVGREGTGGAPGAQVLATVGDRRILRLPQVSGGYLTAGPGTVWFGLGSAERADGFEVRWPGGGRESFPGADAGQPVVLTEGQGESVP